MSREYILRDLEKVERGVAHLIGNEGNNYEVLDSDDLDDYTEPDTNSEIVMPLNHPNGFFSYLDNLRRILNKAYNIGSLEEYDLPPCAPKYLEDLIY